MTRTELSEKMVRGPESRSSVPMLELRDVSKSFGSVQAVKNLSLRVNRNEVIGLIGENGAGKSTLLKVLGGVYEPDSGAVLLSGQPVRLRRPSDAVARGIGMVYQEQSLLPNLTVAENIHHGLGTKQRREAERFGVYRWRVVERSAKAALERIGSPIDPKANLIDLSFAERQMVEIAKAVAVGESGLGAPLVVLDEPTSVLEPAEIAVLETEVARLRTQGSVIFVSHRMSEVLAVSDRVYVMREGEIVAEVEASEAKEEELFRLMAGRDFSSSRRTERPTRHDTPRLRLAHFSHQKAFRDISLDVYAGEIVTIAGAQGSGREHLVRAIYGAEPSDSGSVELDGVRFRGASIAAAVAAGVGYIPAERRTEAIVGGMSVAMNLTLTHPGNSAIGPLRLPGRARAIALSWIEKLSIRPPDPNSDVGRLSGGNQQKVVLAKWLSAPNLRLLLLDHPLRGLDPGAREQVLKMIQQACDDGVAVLLLADTLEEALEVGDRVIVMRDGRISGEFDLHVESVTSVDLVERMV